MGRTNSTTKGREKVTSKKTASMEPWFGREADPGHCCGEGAMVAEKDEKLAHGGVHGEGNSP